MKRFLVFLLSCFSVNAVSAGDLQNTVKDALTNHPEISAAINSRCSSEQDLCATQGGYLPSLDLDAEAGHKNIDDVTTRAVGRNNGLTQSPNEATISLEQDVFNGFTTNSEVTQQKAAVDSRAYGVMNTSESTAYTVIQAYFDVLQREEFMRLAEDDLANHEHVYNQIKLHTDQGVGRSEDFVQVEARLVQARNSLLTEQTNLKDTKTTFVSVTDIDPQGLGQPRSIDSQLSTSLRDTKSRAEENNPLLRSTNADIETTHQQYETSKSTFYPRVDAELSRGVSNNADTTSAHTGEQEVIVRLHYNLYQGGNDEADMNSRTYLHRQAQDIHNNTLHRLNQELRLTQTALQNARAQLPSAEKYAGRSVRVHTVYQDQFSLGEHTLLDLLDSENEVFSSKYRLVKLRYLAMTSGYRISEHTGELMSILKIAPPSSGQPIDSAEGNSLPELR